VGFVQQVTIAITADELCAKQQGNSFSETKSLKSLFGKHLSCWGFTEGVTSSNDSTDWGNTNNICLRIADIPNFRQIW